MTRRVLLFGLLGACVDFDRDGWSVPADCDDGNPGVHPGADELCDLARVDEDCDGAVNEEDDVAFTVLFLDRDADGAGDAGTAHLAESCEAATGMVDNGADCDDERAAVHVGAVEVCDGVDNDCDGAVDDDDPSVDGGSLTTWYRDFDGDQFGTEAEVVEACVAPGGYVSTAGDCDDLRAGISPAAIEICDDGVDENCDGSPYPCGLSGNLLGASVRLSDVSQAAFGASFAVVGDTNGDGWPDVLVGAPEGSTPGPAAVLLFGPFEAWSDTRFLAQLRLGGALGSRAGATVSGGVDLTEDGMLDVVVGAPGAEVGGVPGVGELVVVTGPIGTADRDLASEPVHILGPPDGIGFGANLVRVGDVDGDGADDLLVSVESGGEAVGGIGGVHLLRGPFTTSREMAGTSPDFVGSEVSARLGAAMVGPGDMDGDGVADFALGAPGVVGGELPGVVYLFLGPGGGSLEDADSTLVGAEPSGLYGADLSGVDFDLDGHAEWVVGAPSEAESGRVYLYDGDHLPKDAQDVAARVEGGRPGLACGTSVASVPDSNGDGFPDLVVGCPRVGPSNVDGTVVVFYGPPVGTINPASAIGQLTPGADTIGLRLAVGDLDLNGLGDVLIGQPHAIDLPDGADFLWLARSVGW